MQNYGSIALFIVVNSEESCFYEKNKAQTIALYGLMVALAFVFSYFESLIPFHFGIPGVKLGLANLVVVVALYIMKPAQAFSVAVIRILLASMTFWQCLQSCLQSLRRNFKLCCYVSCKENKAFRYRSKYAWRYLP